MLTPAVFLDRDGTINIDFGYIKDPNLVKLFPFVPEGIKLLKNFGFKIIVISNQAGISYGIMTHADVKNVNNKINELLLGFDTYIDAFYYCPFHPDYNSPEEALCRKPSPDMIVQASKELQLDLMKSYMVGDKSSDILCGLNAGVKTVLLDYEGNTEEINILQNQGKKPNFVAANFIEVYNFITSDYTENSN